MARTSDAGSTAGKPAPGQAARKDAAADERTLKAAVVLGSDSDYPLMQECVRVLKDFNIRTEIMICSAHRTPDKAAEFARNAEKAGFGVIIAAAGKAAHLPGIIAAYTVLPVIGVPLKSDALDGLDALLSIVQMPPGVPVATVAINGAQNAAILAAQILSCGDCALREKVASHKMKLAKTVEDKNESLQRKLAEIG